MTTLALNEIALHTNYLIALYFAKKPLTLQVEVIKEKIELYKRSQEPDQNQVIETIEIFLHHVLARTDTKKELLGLIHAMENCLYKLIQINDTRESASEHLEKLIRKKMDITKKTNSFSKDVLKNAANIALFNLGFLKKQGTSLFQEKEDALALDAFNKNSPRIK